MPEPSSKNSKSKQVQEVKATSKEALATQEQDKQKKMLRSKDIKPFYPQNPKELKKSPGNENQGKLGSMSQAKLTQRNMKVLRKQFFPDQAAQAEDAAAQTRATEADIRELGSFVQ